MTADSDESLNIDDSQFSSLEPPDSPKNFTIVPQMAELTDIQAISNAIKNFQVCLKYILKMVGCLMLWLSIIRIIYCLEKIRRRA